MDVYVVTSGTYSDYHIDIVLSTRELAERVVAAWGENYRIEKWPLDGVYWPPSDMGLWDTEMNRAGRSRGHRCSAPTLEDAKRIGQHRFVGEGWGVPPKDGGTGWESYAWEMTLKATVLARDEQHAMKVANEMRTRLLAENAWPKEKRDADSA